MADPDSWGSSGRRFKSCQPDRENPLRPGSEGIFGFRLRVTVDRRCAKSVPTRRMVPANFARAAPSRRWWFGPRFLRCIEPLSRGPLGVTTGVVDHRADHSAEHCGVTPTEISLTRPAAPSGGGVRRRVAALVSELCCGTEKLSCRTSCRSLLLLGLVIAPAAFACQRRSSRTRRDMVLGIEENRWCATAGAVASYTCRYCPGSGLGRRRRRWQ